MICPAMKVDEVRALVQIPESSVCSFVGCHIDRAAHRRFSIALSNFRAITSHLGYAFCGGQEDSVAVVQSEENTTNENATNSNAGSGGGGGTKKANKQKKKKKK